MRWWFFIFLLGCSNIQKERSCLCTMEFNPVCGEDGKTYANPCAAQCAKVAFKYGECRKPCACTREFIPVCGSDGRSYPNACTAKCEEMDYKEGQCD